MSREQIKHELHLIQNREMDKFNQALLSCDHKAMDSSLVNIQAQEDIIKTLESEIRLSRKGAIIDERV